ncbi:MAG: hypothetical protein NWF06_08795 [Candidatus Bathyarchaeota archaeon]|nr:hypothetical protein [Candidatus Bathyarchaeum sp.]
MKEWQVTLGGAFVMFVSGIVMLLWANSLDIPTTLTVTGYLLISDQYFVTAQAGALFTGVGGGLLLCTLLIYQLEQKLESK